MQEDKSLRQPAHPLGEGTKEPQRRNARACVEIDDLRDFVERPKIGRARLAIGASSLRRCQRRKICAVGQLFHNPPSARIQPDRIRRLHDP